MSPTEIYTDPDSTLAKKFYDILIATDNASKLLSTRLYQTQSNLQVTLSR